MVLPAHHEFSKNQLTNTEIFQIIFYPYNLIDGLIMLVFQKLSLTFS